MSKKWGLVFLAVLLLFFSFSQIFLQSRFVSEKIEQFAESSLEEVLGQKVTIGQATVHLFSASVILKDFSIGAHSVAQPAPFFVEEIQISFSPGSFFTEAFLIRNVHIDAPVVLFPNNILEKAASVKPQARNRQALTPPIIVRSLQVSKGSLTFKGKDPAQMLSLSGIDGQIRPNLEMNRFELDLSGKEGAFSNGKISGKIDAFDGKVIVQDEKINLKRAFITSDQANILAEGMIDIGEETSLDLHVNLHLPIESLPSFGLTESFVEIPGGKAVSGSTRFSGKLTGDIQNPHLNGELSLADVKMDGESVGSIETHLSYQSKQLSLSSFSGELFSGNFSGNLEADLSPFLQNTNGSAPSLSINLHYEALPLDSILKTLTETDLAIERGKGIFLSGELSFSGSGKDFDQIEANGALAAARLPLFSPPVLSDARRMDQLIALFQSGQGHWNWSKGRLTITEAKLRFPRAELAFHGDWQQAEGLHLETAMTSVEVAEISKALRLPLSGRTEIHGVFRYREGVPSFEGKAVLKEGMVRTEAFKSLTSDFDVKGKTIRFEKGRLRGYLSDLKSVRATGDSDYRIKGRLNLEAPKSPRFDFHVDVKSGSPQEVFRFFRIKVPLYTRAKGHLDIQGVPKSFTVKGPLTLGKGTLYGETFEVGRVDLAVTQEEVQLQNLLLVKKESRLAGKGTIRFDQTYTLALKGDQLRIQDTGFLKNRFPALKGDVGLVVTGKGSFKKPQLRFIAAVKQIHYSEMKGVRGTIKADWEGQAVSFGGIFPEENFSMSGEILLAPQHPFTFESQFEHLRIDPILRERLPGPVQDMTLKVSGVLSGSGKLGHLHEVSLSGQFKELIVGLGAYQLKNDGPLSIQSKEGVFSFKNSRLKGKNTALTFNGGLTLQKQWNLFINGEADLNLITFFSEKITSGRGKAFLDLEIRDDWDAPRIRGALNLKEGGIRLASLSQSFQIGSLSALFNKRQFILETLEGRIGGGRFHATGKAELAGIRLGDFGFLLSLDGARIDLDDDLPASMDGELFFQRKGNHQTLKGDLTLKNIVYHKNIDLRKLVVDLINRKRDDFSEETLLIGRTDINIHLFGKEKIRIANNVADIPLVVDLLLKGSFDQPLVIGRVDVSKGKVYFRGNTFKVKTGSVDFLNPEKVDPVFNLKARTDVRNVVTDRRYGIDLDLSGTLSQITLRFSSFPSLPESDILALLAIGKTTADLQTTEGGAGAEATSFVVSEFLGEPVEKFVGKPVEKLTGIDRIRVDPNIDGSNPDATTGTKLTAEKRLLNERLVVIYSTTLDPSEEDLIRMVYEVNKNISLVGKRDEDGQLGGDIRFRFEFR